MDTVVKDAIEGTTSMIRMAKVTMPEYYARHFGTLAGAREAYRDAIEAAREEVVPVAVASSAPATYAEIIEDLTVASRRIQHLGATDAQIATIARLAVRDGLFLSQISVSTLSRKEASNIISTF